jgi:hypothetical protein
VGKQAAKGGADATIHGLRGECDWLWLRAAAAAVGGALLQRRGKDGDRKKRGVMLIHTRDIHVSKSALQNHGMVKRERF